MKLSSIVITLSALLIFPAQAETPIEYAKKLTKNNTEVLVLGTPHLRALKRSFDDVHLDNLVDKLVEFNPSAIADESLRSADIITMTHGVDDYKSVLSRFVGDEFLALAKDTQERLSLTPSQAISKLKTQLRNQNITNEQRIALIETAIAAYDKHTAQLHWAYLESSSQKNKLVKNILNYMTSSSVINNEANLLTIPLAMKAKLSVIYSIDDHLDKDMYAKVINDVMPSMKTSKLLPLLNGSEYVKKPKMLMAQAEKTNDWIPLYTWMNSKPYTKQVIDAEWRLFIDKDMAVNPGLARVALWEVRNLNMVSNIMRVVTENIGGRVIVIVGANHKVFFEDYLSKMIGVKVVQFNELVGSN